MRAYWLVILAIVAFTANSTTAFSMAAECPMHAAAAQDHDCCDEQGQPGDMGAQSMESCLCTSVCLSGVSLAPAFQSSSAPVFAATPSEHLGGDAPARDPFDDSWRPPQAL